MFVLCLGPSHWFEVGRAQLEKKKWLCTKKLKDELFDLCIQFRYKYVPESKN